MKHNDLPERWRAKLAGWMQVHTDGRYPTLGAGDFPSEGRLTLTFEDGSTARFNHAFVIEAPEFREVGVFTEHCGYHLFNAGAVISAITVSQSGAQD